ncbi:lysophospholipid acyltransferase 7 isoform X1 [Protopterus annectens]|uniref:lysophospholipid acyltransferase 7 isoform X1 n=2 Tax=Protopterus annectens TaxID=7888 RepID=UPI001CFA5D06|nr:lysophospholipid acyltransferase 7 isoform X1 [Protopterus annectens]
MSLDELIYLAVLFSSILIGFFFKRTGPREKQLGSTGLGLLVTLATCNIHILHSLITILGTWIILKTAKRYCPSLTLFWTFSYLFFFRMVTYFGLPAHTPFANAVQLLLTLKLVSVASDIQEFRQVKKQEVTSFSKSPLTGLISSEPSMWELLCYSYCYIGIMTGPFYRYRTYQDWLNQIDSLTIPSWEPFLLRLKMAPVYGIFFLLVSYLFPLEYVKSEEFEERAFLFRLFYMMPVFFVFRMRFYVAWIFAECSCIAAGFGAYPKEAKSRSGGGPTVDYSPAERAADESSEVVQYDYETIKNIDCYNTDFCVKVKHGMRYWNMSVQWWLAQYIYRNAPVKSFIFKSAWTMLISAYWHGIHPGYYLSFLTIPLCLAAEDAMERGLRERLSATGKSVFDWVQWFFKMRSYDYMCMGFVLLTYSETMRYWRSIYFLIHVLAVGFLLLGNGLVFLEKAKRKSKRERDVTAEQCIQ